MTEWETQFDDIRLLVRKCILEAKESIVQLRTIQDKLRMIEDKLNLCPILDERLQKSFKSGRDRWQELLDVAYARWKTGDLQNLSYDDFVESLMYTEREAVLLGNLHYEVSNWGFSQWARMGYASQLDNVIQLLFRIGGTAAELGVMMRRSRGSLERFYHGQETGASLSSLSLQGLDRWFRVRAGELEKLFENRFNDACPQSIGD